VYALSPASVEALTKRIKVRRERVEKALDDLNLH
jgi:hypothetical protein